jgi:hypothetical protein
LLNDTIAKNLITWTENARLLNPQSLEHLQSVTIIPDRYDTHFSGYAHGNSIALKEFAGEDTFTHEIAHINANHAPKSLEKDFRSVGGAHYKYPNFPFLAYLDLRFKKGNCNYLPPKEGFVDGYGRMNVDEHIATLTAECRESVPNDLSKIDPEEREKYIFLIESLARNKLISQSQADLNIATLASSHPKFVSKRLTELADSLPSPRVVRFLDYGHIAAEEKDLWITYLASGHGGSMLHVSLSPVSTDSTDLIFDWGENQQISPSKRCKYSIPPEFVKALNEKGYAALNRTRFDQIFLLEGETLEQAAKRRGIPKDELKGPVEMVDPINGNQFVSYYRPFMLEN